MEFLNHTRSNNSLAVHCWVRQQRWPLTSGLQKNKSSLNLLALNRIFAKPKASSRGMGRKNRGWRVREDHARLCDEDPGWMSNRAHQTGKHSPARGSERHSEGLKVTQLF